MTDAISTNSQLAEPNDEKDGIAADNCHVGYSVSDSVQSLDLNKRKPTDGAMGTAQPISSKQLQVPNGRVRPTLQPLNDDYGIANSADWSLSLCIPAMDTHSLVKCARLDNVDCSAYWDIMAKPRQSIPLRRQPFSPDPSSSDETSARDRSRTASIPEAETAELIFTSPSLSACPSLESVDESHTMTNAQKNILSFFPDSLSISSIPHITPISTTADKDTTMQNCLQHSAATEHDSINLPHTDHAATKAPNPPIRKNPHAVVDRNCNDPPLRKIPGLTVDTVMFLSPVTSPCSSPLPMDTLSQTPTDTVTPMQFHRIQSTCSSLPTPRTSLSALAPKKEEEKKESSAAVVTSPTLLIHPPLEASQESDCVETNTTTAMAEDALALTQIGAYRFVRRLGEGSFASVYLARDTRTDRLVALKLVEKHATNAADSVVVAANVERARKEAILLRTLNHPNIVAILDEIETKDFYGLVLEYADSGDLFEWSMAQHTESNSSRIGPHVFEAMVRDLFAQLLCAVTYLHEQGIVHRDIKLENVLLLTAPESSAACHPSGLIVKLADFGLATHYSPTIYSPTAEAGSDEYTAPEVVMLAAGAASYPQPTGPSSYDRRKMDVWALGIILYALLFGRMPFLRKAGQSRRSFLYQIAGGNIRFPTNDGINETAVMAVRALLKRRPGDRLSAAEACKLPWLCKLIMEDNTGSKTIPMKQVTAS